MTSGPLSGLWRGSSRPPRGCHGSGRLDAIRHRLLLCPRADTICVREGVLVVKPRDFFYTLGLRPKTRTYGFRIDTFHLPKEGEIEYAQWLHPRATPQKISQESIDELRKFLSP